MCVFASYVRVLSIHFSRFLLPLPLPLQLFCHCRCQRLLSTSLPPPHHFIFLAFALLRLLRLVLPLLWFHVNCSERRLFRQSALILKLDLQTTTSHCCCCWCCCCFAVAAQLQFAPQSTHNTHTYSISTHIAFSQRTIPFAVPT